MTLHLVPGNGDLLPSGRLCIHCGAPVWKKRKGRPPRYCSAECEDRFYAHIRSLRNDARCYLELAETCRRAAENPRAENGGRDYLLTAESHQSVADGLLDRVAMLTDPSTRWEDL